MGAGPGPPGPRSGTGSTPNYRDVAAGCWSGGVTPRDLMLAAPLGEGGRPRPAAAGRCPTTSPAAASASPPRPWGPRPRRRRGRRWPRSSGAPALVTLVTMGEGATNQGDVHEAVNFAGNPPAPLILLGENNGYAISVPQKQVAVPDVAVRAAGYGMPGVMWTATTPSKSTRAMREAVERARGRRGPALIEAKVTRLTGHSTDDEESKYRPEEEVAAGRGGSAPGVSDGAPGGLPEGRMAAEAEITAEVRWSGWTTRRILRRGGPRPGCDHRWTAPRRPRGPARRSTTDGRHDPHRGDPRRAAATRCSATSGSSSSARTSAGGRRLPRHRRVPGRNSATERVIDTPLAESGIIGGAIGMALNGLRPIAEIQFLDFILSGDDQIMNEAARIRYRSNGDFACPLVIRAPFGGGVHGALYHSQSHRGDLRPHAGAQSRRIPPPRPTPRGCSGARIRDDDPVLYLEHKKMYRSIKGEVPRRRLRGAARAGADRPGGQRRHDRHLWADGPRSRERAAAQVAGDTGRRSS